MTRFFPEAKVQALFELADIKVTKLHRLENKYWPDGSHYDDLRRRSPWWLVMTEFGPIEVGWRKRVLSIRWEDTPARVVVTEDQTTKDETMVHAWTYPKAVEYLSKLSDELRRNRVPVETPEAEHP